jgi:hypothetical protein
MAKTRGKWDCLIKSIKHYFCKISLLNMRYDFYLAALESGNVYPNSHLTNTFCS